MSTSPVDFQQPAEEIVCPPKKERLPHSTCGVISFILAILSVVVFIGSNICIWGMGGYDPNFFKPQDMKPGTPVPLVFIISGFFTWGCIVASYTALILGIVGLFMPCTRKVYSLLGIVLSGPPIVLVVVFSIIIMILMMIGFTPPG